ncbi:MAG: hypothetical protein LBN71_08880 [Tannerella sp.]|nr:hypothetical protein [Tannerella sp.]
MSTIELEVIRAEVARLALSEESEKVLKKVLSFFRKANQSTLSPPCRFTIEELKVEVTKSLEDIKNGQCVTTEDLLKKHPEWL